ncbi:MAG: cell division protein FtsI [Firmicutes bacterium]|nr:cell division protein FtsI [Bacillota bacterium]
MNKIREYTKKLFRLYMILFFILGMYIGYIQVAKSGEFMSNTDNPRNYEKMNLRGTIFTRDGKPLAISRDEVKPSGRAFPEKNIYEPYLGYLSVKFGKGGLEDKLDKFLRFSTKNTDFIDYLMRKETKGENVYLTIDPRLQQAAVKALGERKGAVVMMNPRTGEILALASYPSFDPDKLDKDWKKLTSDKDSPFLIRPVNGSYPPGSVFKLFTLASCIEEGVVTPDTVFDCSGDYAMDYELGTYHIREAGGAAHGSVTAVDALVHSCNVGFAQMGLKLGKNKFYEYAGKFGFTEKPDFMLCETEPGFPAKDVLTPTQLAQVAFGQGELTLSPLSIALMTSAFANGGKICKPQIIKSRVDEKGKVVYKCEAEVWKTPVSMETAKKVRDAMIQVVERGTGTAARMDTIKVAGKTGSAENPFGETHAWFTCFAPAEDPKILIVVIVENGGGGGKTAAPVAKELLDLYFSKPGTQK